MEQLDCRAIGRIVWQLSRCKRRLTLQAEWRTPIDCKAMLWSRKGPRLGNSSALNGAPRKVSSIWLKAQKQPALVSLTNQHVSSAHSTSPSSAPDLARWVETHLWKSELTFCFSCCLLLLVWEWERLMLCLSHSWSISSTRLWSTPITTTRCSNLWSKPKSNQWKLSSNNWMSSKKKSLTQINQKQMQFCRRPRTFDFFD